MQRHFIRPDYASALTRPITVEEAVPPDHLARWLLTIIATWDLTPLYARYEVGGRPPYAPEILLALLLYGYCTGVTSGRAIEQATYESLPFRLLAAFTHPDHTTLDRFRTACLPDLAGLLAQTLLLARRAGYLAANPIVSIDGSKIHADASQHHAVSYQHACQVRAALQQQIAELRALPAAEVPPGMEVAAEITLREERITQLTVAIQVIEARAEERDQRAQAEYDAKLAARAAQEQATGKKPRGKTPQPPSGGPQPKDQYNFTDPESRIMKNGTNTGVDQDYNVQVVVDQASRLILGCAVSHHASDQGEVTTAVDTVPAAVGTPRAAALDAGYYSAANIAELEARQIIPLIATGKRQHGLDWRAFYQPRDETAPPLDAAPTERARHALESAFGQAIYRQRKSTVEPTFGTTKETMRFRQFSLRGEAKVTGEWWLVSLAYDLKGLHVLAVSAQRQGKACCRHLLTKIRQFAHFLTGGCSEEITSACAG